MKAQRPIAINVAILLLICGLFIGHCCWFAPMSLGSCLCLLPFMFSANLEMLVFVHRKIVREARVLITVPLH